MKHALWCIPLLGAALLLSGCGGSGAQPTPDALSKADAVRLKDGLLQGNRQLARSLSSRGPLTSLAVPGAGLSAQAIDCSSTKTPTSPTDADADSIALSVDYAVDCTVSSDKDLSSVSLKGATRVRDKNDADPKSGFSVDTDEYTLTTKNAQGTVSSTTKLDYDLDLSVQGSAYALKYNFAFSSAGSSAGGNVFAGAHNVTAGYTPDSTSTPFAAGTFQYAGTASLTAGGKTYALTGSATGLHYTQACADSAFDRGTLSYKDARGNALTFTFNSCTSYTVTYNGEAI